MVEVMVKLVSPSNCMECNGVKQTDVFKLCAKHFSGKNKN